MEGGDGRRTGEGDMAGDFFGGRDWGVVVGHLCAWVSGWLGGR